MQNALPARLRAALPVQTTRPELLIVGGPLPDPAVVMRAWLDQFMERTRQSYAYDIDQFARWLTTVGLGTWDVTRKHALAYARWVETLTLSPSSRARRLSTPSSFYQYAASEDVIPANPFSAIRRPKVSTESTRRGLTALQFRALLDEAAKEGARSHALVALLGLQGLRVSEACGIRTEDVGRHQGHHVVTVTRKGGKRQRIGLAPEASEALSAAMKLERSDDRVIGWARHYSGVVVARVAKKAKIPFHVHPHALRHTWATLCLNAGVSPRDVQAAGGWSTASMVQRYDREQGSLARSPSYVLAAQVAAYESPYDQAA